MWINYHHLFYFKVIAEEQSVSKAAEKLRLGQPTLSAQLKQFEDYLGVKLFDRYHKKLVLTEQGKIALSYAQNIFKLGSEMVDTLQDRIVPEKIKLQIGSLDSIPKGLVAELSQACYQKFNVQIGFVEGSLDYLLRELDAHKIDLLISNYLPYQKETKTTTHRLISRQEVKVFGAGSYKNLKKKFPEGLNQQKMILPSFESKVRADLDHWFRINQLQMDIVAESQDLSLKKHLALADLGLIACTEAAVADLLQTNQLFELGTVKGVFEEIYLISQDRKMKNPVAQFLMSEGFQIKGT